MERISGLNRVNDDVLALICAAISQLQPAWNWDGSRYTLQTPLKAFSLTCRRVWARCVPYLFQRSTLHCVGRNMWTRAVKTLNDWNPAYSKYLRKLSIALSDPLEPWPAIQFVEELATTLANTLDMITKAAVNLQSLRVEIGGYRIALFQAAFAARGLMFPHVRRLIVSPSNHYMVDHCPHTTILAGSDRYGPFKDPNIELVERAATLSDLECFALRTSWDGTLLKVLAETDMKVRTLLIPGTLGLHLTYEALAEPLSLLPSVKVLSIPGISELHAGFEPSDDDNTENSAQKRREAEERVAAFIFDRCPGLKELWFDQATKAIRKQEERGGSRGVSNAGLVWSRGDEIETPAWAGLI